MARKYSPSASKDVEREMHKLKRGNLKSGKGGKGGTVKESQASHCNRAFRGAQKGQKGSDEEGQLGFARPRSIRSERSIGAFLDEASRPDIASRARQVRYSPRFARPLCATDTGTGSIPRPASNLCRPEKISRVKPNPRFAMKS